jgi:hypothetical protein
MLFPAPRAAELTSVESPEVDALGCPCLCVELADARSTAGRQPVVVERPARRYPESLVHTDLFSRHCSAVCHQAAQVVSIWRWQAVPAGSQLLTARDASGLWGLLGPHGSP